MKPQSNDRSERQPMPLQAGYVCKIFLKDGSIPGREPPPQLERAVGEGERPSLGRASAETPGQAEGERHQRETARPCTDHGQKREEQGAIRSPVLEPDERGQDRDEQRSRRAR